MINQLQKTLGALARAQQKHLVMFVFLILLITAVAGYGVTKVTLESDLSKLNPEGLPITELNDEIGVKFDRLDNMVVAVQLDDSVDSSNVPRDIRDPEIVNFLLRLEDNLREDPGIQEVQSFGSFFRGNEPNNINEVKAVLDNIPSSGNLINKDYSLTFVIVESDIGGDSQKIKEFDDRIEAVVENSGVPRGIKTVVTGEVPLAAVIFNLLISDAVTTLIIALIFIFILVLIMQRSLKGALVIIIPLLFGLFWTLGALGLTNTPITIGTAGLSAMLLGLGMEYAVFLVSRYNEERRTKDVNKSLEIAISNVGSSLVSSGGTTTIGFAALATSIFPVLSGLGLSLAIGIVMLLIATILVTPMVVIISEKIKKTVVDKKEVREGRIIKIFRNYGRLVSNYPKLFFLFAVLITGFMFVGMQQIELSDVDFETLLPEDLEAMLAFVLIQEEFGETVDMVVYMELDPSLQGTNEPIDMRDPRVLAYTDILSNKLKNVDHVLAVSSLSEVVKRENNGVIPHTITTNRGLFDRAPNLITKDYGVSVIRITLDEGAISDRAEVVRQAEEVVETTSKPAGINTIVAGEGAAAVEQDIANGTDSQKTSLISLVLIVVFLLILSRSIKGTILPLLTVILGVVWTLGLVGHLNVPFNNITTSVITMTIGIGIDFGLQLQNRYNYELLTAEKVKAMENALTGVLMPMVITVIGAVVGFRAMSFGQLNLMGDLGTTMSLAIIASMFAAIIGVASLMVIFQKRKAL